MQRKCRYFYMSGERAKQSAFPLHKARSVLKLKPSYHLPDLPPPEVVKTAAVLKP